METLAAFVVVPALVIACLSAIFGLAQVLPTDQIRRLGHDIWPLRLTFWQVMSALVAAALLFLVFENGAAMAFVIVLASFFVLAWFVRAWSHEFVFLMGLRDTDLPGRHDKLIWALLLLIFPPISTWLFRSYRQTHWPDSVADVQSPLQATTQTRAGTELA
jgi:hypothetical protein